MGNLIGIRREDKSRWERRAPLTPLDVCELVEGHGIGFVVQPSEIRIFSDDEYRGSGARVEENLSGCDVILAIKEIPAGLLLPGKAYVFFSHTIKGQPQNMPMLKRLMELGCELLDYEKVVDTRGRRLLFFGRFAGMAGMIDTLWALGRRLAGEGISNPFEEVEQAHQYGSLEAVRTGFARVAERIEGEGLPEAVCPLGVGIAGYGNVSGGAQEVLDLLPVREVSPEELCQVGSGERNVLYKVVFKEEHMVRPRSAEDRFELQDYYRHPEKYAAAFADYLPYLTVLVNCIYWDERYPRLVTREGLKRFYGESGPRLRAIGDISCDIEGAIECTLKVMQPDDPVFTYDPLSGKITDGYEGAGTVVMAVDHLPCELARDSSEEFSGALKKFMPALARADFSVSLDELDLPGELKAALIVHHGKLAPPYRFIADLW